MILIPLLASAVLSAAPPDVELIGEMDSESLGIVYSQLGRVMGGEGKKDVTLRISSPGGNGIATLLFIDQVNDMKARQHAKITCVASVMAASAAAILLESPVCDRRVMTDATILLFHGVRSGASGKTGEIEDTLHLLKGLDRMVANMIAPRMGMTPDEYLTWIDRHDQWLTPNEALARGAVDAVGASGVGPSPAAKAEQIKAAPIPHAPSKIPAKIAKAKAWLIYHRVQLITALAVVNGILALIALHLARRPAPIPVPVRRKRNR